VSYETTDTFFAAALQYLWGEDSLTRIETTQTDYGRDTPTFTLDVPSDEAEELLKTFQDGELAISDLKSWARTYTWLTRRLREMKKRGETSYMSPSWIRGRG